MVAGINHMPAEATALTHERGQLFYASAVCLSLCEMLTS